MAASKALVLITGANQGIGFSIAQQMASSGKFHVLLGSRSTSKADTAIQQLLADKQYPVEAAAVSPVSIDVSDDTSILDAAKAVKEKYGSLDILINNAGIPTGAPGLGIRDNFRAVFETNVFGVAVVINAFLPLLRASKYHDRRIVNVSSGQGRISMALARGTAANAQPGVHQYRSSKAAVNMLTALNSVLLAEEGIAVVGAAPGYCRTGMNGGQGMKDAVDGAKPIIRAATEGNPKELSGTLVADEHTQFGW
ncbi:Short-chain dehydrogenase/reductase tropE [Lachnellula cervina]|uniref:Short-chain dehydrogenase/reductase tropE n=1 Tax=Lachnellula cervina TaxID=1316786 RepID=A0A7D8YPM7_9HELO|nr:Short-chain dehydrogenase/reductase tropE [Lachnellula cervina]